MLPVLLLELDDIIYDDVIFCRNLLGLANLDMGENLIVAFWKTQ